ncbi:DUF3263 domain-containing protein [Actinopolymorpha sp. B17G11]|uniref:DUF3263 domain-containing protein n=1 Tax=Actinopolymorpha sp. B17G11 TaxID=3160861 RepID=UPI0032E4DF24
MTTILRDELHRDSRGTVHAVYDDNGARIGSIVRQDARPHTPFGPMPERWYVSDAGNGVRVSSATGYDSADAAITAIRNTRDTSPALARTESGLTRRDETVLIIERTRFVQPGAKQQAIVEAGFTPHGYARRLAYLINEPDPDDAEEVALAHAVEAFDPLLVKRLRRLRDRHTRAGARSA